MRTETRKVAEKVTADLNNSTIFDSLSGSRKEQVLAFHELYDCPIHRGDITLDAAHMTTERIAMRLGLIVEEVKELLLDGFGIETNIYFKPNETSFYTNVKDALEVSRESGFNITEAADALGDISYVVDGFALELGFDLDEVINEIHASNLTKLDSDGSVLLREDGKVLKGPNYVKPNIEQVLRKLN